MQNKILARDSGYNKTRAIIERVYDKITHSLQNNVIYNPLYDGSATVTQETAVDAGTTRDLDPFSIRNLRYNIRNGLATGGTNDLLIYTVQKVTGSGDKMGSIEFVTDSETITFAGRRQSSDGFRIAINDQYLTSKEIATWSTAAGADNFVVLSGLDPYSKVRFEWNGNYVFEHLYLEPKKSIWRPEDGEGIVAAVLGDSITEGSGATYAIDGFAHKIGNLAGFEICCL